MDLTFEGERTKQTEEKEQRLRKKGEREGRDAKKKNTKKMYVYISHILVSSTQKMLGNVISK